MNKTWRIQIDKCRTRNPNSKFQSIPTKVQKFVKGKWVILNDVNKDKNLRKHIDSFSEQKFVKTLRFKYFWSVLKKRCQIIKSYLDNVSLVVMSYWRWEDGVDDKGRRGQPPQGTGSHCPGPRRRRRDKGRRGQPPLGTGDTAWGREEWGEDAEKACGGKLTTMVGHVTDRSKIFFSNFWNPNMPKVGYIYD